MKTEELLGKTILAAEAKAAPGDLKKVAGVAYAGGAIAQRWSNVPLVIDLAGMSFAPQIPLLEDHLNNPAARVGAVTARVAGNALEITGGIDTATERGAALADAGRRIPWQLSIGASVDKARFVEAKESATVNGRAFDGPVVVVEKSTLREVSIVAVAADAETTLSIAAGLPMPAGQDSPGSAGGADGDGVHGPSPDAKAAADAPSSTLPESGAASDGADPGTPAAPAETTAEAPGSTPSAPETARAAAVPLDPSAPVATVEAARAALGALPVPSPEFLDRAVAAGWTPYETLTAAIKLKQKEDEMGSTPTPTNLLVKAAPAQDAAWLKASMGLRAGLDGTELEKTCGAPAVEAADKAGRDMTLRDFVMAACRIDGREQAAFGNDAIRAAFSSQTLADALASTANARALKAFNAYPGIATRLCTEGDLADFKESDRYRVNAIGDLEKVAEGGEIKHGTLGADTAKNKLETYGRAFVITRQMIYNDSLGEFLKLPAALGTKAKRKIDELFFRRLLANPEGLFSAAHKNYATGSASALAAATLAAGVAAFQKQTDAEGNPIALDPKFLVVPPALYVTALELVKAAQIQGTTNVLSAFGLEVVSAPYLSNAAYTGHSDTGWYLFADPALCETFEIGYLNGRRAPTVEQTSVDFDNLGLGFRVYFDLGVREQDFRGMYFAKGAN